MESDDLDDTEFDRLQEAKLDGNLGAQDAIDTLINRRARERTDPEQAPLPTAVVVRDSPEDLDAAYAKAPVIEVDSKTRTEVRTRSDGSKFARFADGTGMVLGDA